ncbi:MAG: sodium:proton exchanger [Bacteroidetes bacterium]|nr:MAG: sodium:proton exchanger [Bacteroidota bacterium]
MEILQSYNFIILITSVVILSFLFNAVSERTNIPAVLMLILTGILIKAGLAALDVPDLDLGPILEIVGIVGLIMIVLEAALDLELTKEKWPIIWKSFSVALLGLIVSMFVSAWILRLTVPGMEENWLIAMLYATPISILSSAIIIPSVGNLRQEKKEFHIYESTFSDILGIMVFYFLQGLLETQMEPGGKGGGTEVLKFFTFLLATVVISFLASYILVLLFQNLRSQVKLFMLISILVLLYAVGKQLHLSSLIIILIFGLVLSNHHLFFRGFLKRWLKEARIKDVESDFHVVTVESAFLVRTFFFVIFGMTISLASLWNLNVLLISLALLVSIYVVRWGLFVFFIKKDIVPQLYIAPRGLITVLLFFTIPAEVQVAGFDSGILLFIIIATSLIMAVALIAEGKRRSRMARLSSDPLVVPPERIYEGFQSKLLAEKYQKESLTTPQKPE